MLHLDQRPHSTSASTLGAALAILRGSLAEEGKVIVEISVDGTVLEGPALSEAQGLSVAERTIHIATELQVDLARRMIGKMAALVEYLATQHRQVASLLEQNQAPKALGQLSGVLSAWHQVHTSYGSLAQLLRLDLTTLAVDGRMAPELIGEFQTHLREIETALRNQDMVLLADILQYELDRTIEIWTNVLATTLGIVDGQLSATGEPVQ